MTSLLAQKKDIKRQQLLLDRMRAESEAEMAASRAAARERVLKEFETAQTSLGSKTTAGKVVAATDGPRGTKRTFELDEDEVEKLMKEATEEAMGRTAREMAEARKAKLPNYWLVRLIPASWFCAADSRHMRSQPSLTPSSTPETVIDVKLQTLCQASKPLHPVSLKTLTTVKFTEDPVEKNASGNPVVLCPSCRKTITNNVQALVLKACGDVLWCAASALPFPDSQGI